MGELRYMILRSVELLLGVENESEENSLVRQFSRASKLPLELLVLPRTLTCINASVAGRELSENERIIDIWDPQTAGE